MTNMLSDEMTSRNKAIKVSVIIPVYNCKDFLYETIESVRLQTHRNLEIMIVDDGSTDGSGEYCDSARINDARVRVFHKMNGGVASARNYALDRISGEYVVFVDADDLVKPDYVEKMLQVAREMDSKIVTCRFMRGAGKLSKDFYEYETTKCPEISEIELSKYRWTGKYAHPETCGAIFFSELLQDIRFPVDLQVGEDAVFFSLALKQAGRLVFIDEQYYFYRYREGSVMHSKFEEKHMTEITARERINSLFEDQPKAFRNECEAVLAIRCMQNYLKAVASHFPDKQFVDGLYKKAWKRRANVLCSSGYSTKMKIHFFAFLLFPIVYIKYNQWRQSE